MLKKTIQYNDLDGNPLEETFEFHLSRAELAEMFLGKEGAEGGFETWVKNLMSSQNGEEIVSQFKKILLATIGKRTADNKSFIKTDEIRQNFEGSDAYSKLFMEIVTSTDNMIAFINGVVPKDMQEEAAKATKEAAAGATPAITTTVNATPEPKDDRPDWLKDPSRIPTEAELRGASPELMLEAFRRKSAAPAGSE